MAWKKGRGLLGPLTPLIGSWEHKGDSAMGPLVCVRSFEPVLSGKWVRLRAVWTYEDKDRDHYEEMCLYGKRPDGKLGFSSFINNGDQSQGWLSTAADISDEAVCFEADMPHGRARQIYWPDGEDGMIWRVDRQVKAGWSPIIEQHYRPTS